MTSSNDSISHLLSVIRDSSVSRMKNLSKRDDIYLSEVPHKPIVYAHWMSFILLSGSSLRVLFKAHYQSEAAKGFAAKSYDSSKKDVTKPQALDFFREFCNLTAGNIKLVLFDSDVKVGISLPILARGFDDIFYPRDTASTFDSWALNCQDEKVYCSTDIEVLENFALRDDLPQNEANEGNVEFL